jgi:hypothetical protein
MSGCLCPPLETLPIIALGGTLVPLVSDQKIPGTLVEERKP